MKYFVIYKLKGDVDNETIVSEWNNEIDAKLDYESACNDFDLEFLYITQQVL